MMTAGKQGCRCFNSTATLASLTERSCVEPETGATGILLTLGGSCVPLSYGASACLLHDGDHDPLCRPAAGLFSHNTTPPVHCSVPWCFVDESCATESHERVYRSEYFDFDAGVDLFYSYSTCYSSADAWLEFENEMFGKNDNVLDGVNIKANIATYYSPMMYKRDSTSGDILATTGSEYYDNNIPFEGIYLDYARSIVKESNGDIGTITYTARSRASSDVHPESFFTAAVQDIEDGLVDMSVGPFWVTAERLQMAAFTVPLSTDRIVLVVKNPGMEESLWQEMEKIILPFKLGLWVCLMMTIVVTSLFGLWFSDYPSLRDVNRIPGQRRSKSAYLRMAFDRLLQNGMNFCSAGVQEDAGASLPSKLLMFGFGFIILTSVSTYVANLAAFLTRKTLSGSVTTIEEAVADGLAICAHPVLKSEMEKAWPEATFVFDDSGNDWHGVLDFYKRNKCKVLAVGTAETVTDAAFHRRMCKLELVYTRSTILEIPIAFPIRAQLAQGFSHWVIRAKTLSRISIQSVTEDYFKDSGKISKCNVDIEVVSHGNDYERIGISQMAFPFTFFAVFLVLASILQLIKRREDGRASNLMGRSSQIDSMVAPVPAAAAADDSLQEGQQHTCHGMVESPLHEEGQHNIVNHQEGFQVRFELGHAQGPFRKRNAYLTAER